MSPPFRRLHQDYTNSILFITYLFVACFILLSMFFAILGEAQANLRDDQRMQLQKDKAEFREPEPEYGVLSKLFAVVPKVLVHMPGIGGLIKKARAEAAAEAQSTEKEEGATPVDRIESRQLELAEKVELILQANAEGRSTRAEVNARMAKTEAMVQQVLRLLIKQQVHEGGCPDVAAVSATGQMQARADGRATPLQKKSPNKSRPLRQVGNGDAPVLASALANGGAARAGRSAEEQREIEEGMQA